MSWSNLQSWLVGSTRNREFEETRAAWAETEALWRNSPFVPERRNALVLSLMREVVDETPRAPATPILTELCIATDKLLQREDLGALEAEWPLIESDAAVAVNFRAMVRRRRRVLSGFEQMFGIMKRQLKDGFLTLFRDLPEACFRDWDLDDEGVFGVPLAELLDRPAETIERLVLLAYDDETLHYELFWNLRTRLVDNLLIASGFSPTVNIHDVMERVVMPTRQKNKSPMELAEMYLAGTPWMGLMELAVPFAIPDEARFEHAHILGGTGHGKTQLMQRMIHADLVAAMEDGRSIVVIDSQGDLINKLVRLDLFDPDRADSLCDRLVLVDPADVEYPPSLNLFDTKLERLAEYRPADRERVLNAVVELYETFFGDLLGAELTQKQGVIFKYLARLMMTIPGATIHTLMQLMEDGKAFRPQMKELDGSTRYFFEKEFFHPSFAATKKQILRRLWGVLATPAFERMFAQKANKLDLFQAMQDGKIILVSTAKDLLKEEGSRLFGRFFIAMLTQAALERSTVPEGRRTPTFVYVDEAQEYFDDRTETILNQARKYRVAFHCAHQALDQLSARLRAVLFANTSLKCVGGVSAKDARAVHDELHTTSEFIERMKRRKDRSEFAVWLKHETPTAIRLSVPLGFVERQPLMPEEGFEALLELNRVRYCGTLADVSTFDPVPLASSSEGSEEVVRAPPAGMGPLETPAGPRHVNTPAPATPQDAEKKPASPSPKRDLGKGGSQHRYVQHLIRALAQDRGFRVVIEEVVDGGQIDVALHREDASIACEISVSSTPTYEAQNLAKCLRGDFTRVFAVAGDAKRLKAIRAAVENRLGPEELGRIDFLTPEDLPAALDAMAAPTPEENMVRGYRVKVSRRAIGADEAKDRRATIARLVANSMRKAGDKDGT